MEKIFVGNKFTIFIGETTYGHTILAIEKFKTGKLKCFTDEKGIQYKIDKYGKIYKSKDIKNKHECKFGVSIESLNV